MKTRRQQLLARACVLLLAAVGFAALCFVLSPDARCGCARLLGAAGADDAVAAMLTDDSKDVRETAREVLIGRGAAAVPALLRRLDRGDDSERVSAAMVLGRIGPPAREAVPALMKCMREDPSEGVRSQAALAFGLVGRDDPEVVAALGRMLSSAAASDRRGAAFAFRFMSGDVKSAVPALMSALNDPEPDVREEAAKALTSIVGNLGDEDAALKKSVQAAVAKSLAAEVGERP